MQLHHRALALTTVSSAAALWASAQALPLPPQVRLAVDLLAIGSAAQLSLGIATVVHCVPVELGSAHQAGALTLFSLMISPSTRAACRTPPHNSSRDGGSGGWRTAESEVSPWIVSVECVGMCRITVF